MINVTPLALKSLSESSADLAVFAYENVGLTGVKALPAKDRTLLAEKLKEEHFKGAAKEIARVDMTVFGKLRRVFVVGLGGKKNSGPENYRRAAGGLLGAVRGKRQTVAVLCSDHVQAVAEGLTLATYKYEEYKKGDADRLTNLHLLIADAGVRVGIEKTLAKVSLYAEAVALARDLVNRGPSDKTPKSLAELAQTFDGAGVKVK